MTTRLNAQIANEFGAAHKYLAIACFFDDLALPALTSFFEKQSAEEREHAEKFIRYLRDVNARVTLDAIAKPEANWKTPLEAIQAALDSEVTVTQQINGLVDLAIKDNDHASREFLNWFISEQVEEVSTMTTLRDAAKLAGQDYLKLNSYVRHWNSGDE